MSATYGDNHDSTSSPSMFLPGIHHWQEPSSPTAFAADKTIKKRDEGLLSFFFLRLWQTIDYYYYDT